MQPYRISGGPGAVVLSTLASTFWLRLRVRLKGLRRRWLRILTAGILLPLPVALIAAGFWDSDLFGISLATFLLGGEAAGIAAALGLSLFFALVQSLVPSPLERALPRKITLRAETITVEPRLGEPFDTTWDWILRADEREGTVDLVISEAPHIELYVSRPAVTAPVFELLRSWLVHHEKLLPE